MIVGFPGEGEAEFGETLRLTHFGNQGDLEWIYVVDIFCQSVFVFGGGYIGDGPKAHLKAGPVDPLISAELKLEEYQDAERTGIAMMVDLICEEDWAVNPADYSVQGVTWAKPKKKRVKKLPPTAKA